MLTSCTDKKRSSTNAAKITLDLQGQEWQPECLVGIAYTVEFPAHLSPALFTYCWQGPHQAPSQPSKIWKASQRKGGGNLPCERKAWVAVQSMETTTDLKCQGTWRASHDADRGGGHWPPLATSGLSLRRRSKTDADPSEGRGTWEEHVWVSNLPSRRTPF